tara:strand:+ start:865 stop:1095 length:231 start_codon:yes stop_codon:yes gene_type:complete
MVDGEVYVVSMFWRGPKNKTNLVTRVYDEVKSGDEAFGKAYAACLADFDETGWTLKNYTVMELETMWTCSNYNEEE